MLYWNGNRLVVSAAKARCKSFSKEGLAWAWPEWVEWQLWKLMVVSTLFCELNDWQRRKFTACTFFVQWKGCCTGESSLCAIGVRGCKEKWCNGCVLGMAKMGPMPSSLCCIPLCQIIVAFQGTTFCGVGNTLYHPCWFCISHISWWWGYMLLNLWFPNVFDDSVCRYPCPVQLLVN